MSVFKGFRQIVARLVGQPRLDQRRLQLEIDNHRLFLLTSHWSRQRQSAEDIEGAYIEEFTQQAEKLGFEGMQASVASCLRSQLVSVAHEMHRALQDFGDNVEAAAAFVQEGRRRGEARQVLPGSGRKHSGLAFATGNIPLPDSSPAQRQAEVSSATSLFQAPPRHSKQCVTGHLASTDIVLGPGSTSSTLDELADMLHARLGYNLMVAPSAIDHPEAGDGLWLHGRAPIGSIVCLYPGVVYPKSMHRHVPGFPLVDRHNPYLMARFDFAIIDGKPWGRGAWQPLEKVPPDGTSPQNMQRLRLLEGRNPLAMGHFANHPPKGTLPNVMVASFDFARESGEEPWLPAYMPTVRCAEPQPSGFQSEEMLQPQQAERPDPWAPVLGIALVALRDLENEELYLNYRLSPHQDPPDWYHPVDKEEAERRWA